MWLSAWKLTLWNGLRDGRVKGLLEEPLDDAMNYDVIIQTIDYDELTRC